MLHTLLGHYSPSVRLLAAGLLIGTAGGMLVPDRPAGVWLRVLPAGASGVWVGELAMRAVLGPAASGAAGSGFALLVSALFTGTYTVSRRARRLAGRFCR